LEASQAWKREGNTEQEMVEVALRDMEWCLTRTRFEREEIERRNISRIDQIDGQIASTNLEAPVGVEVLEGEIGILRDGDHQIDTMTAGATNATMTTITIDEGDETKRPNLHVWH
jgi:hypothetical protein